MKTEKPINVHDSNKGMFNTRSGLLVDINNPTIEMICSEDIAHALSKICRFGGHTLGHYSVAEHSILVAVLAPDEMKLEALLHDASEAYLGDVIKPLKNILGDVYKKLEVSFENAIQQKYNLEHKKLIQIKQYDKQALELEHDAYIKDNISTFRAINTMISDELNCNYEPWQIPQLFLKLLNTYQIGKF